MKKEQRVYDCKRGRWGNVKEIRGDTIAVVLDRDRQRPREEVHVTEQNLEAA